ncbi:MAG: hypothetical protein ACRCSS_03355 [Shewanella sp.]
MQRSSRIQSNYTQRTLKRLVDDEGFSLSAAAKSLGLKYKRAKDLYERDGEWEVIREEKSEPKCTATTNLSYKQNTDSHTCRR